MNVATPETEAPGLTEEQAVNQLLDRWKPAEKPAPKQEKAEPEDTPEDTQAEQPQGDAQAEVEPAETEESADEFEIDVAGEKFKFPKAHEESLRRVEAKAKEVEAGATRKFQEAADLRKVHESLIQSAKQLHQISEGQADLLADHRMVARRLQALEKVDINAVEPDVLSRLNAEYNQLQAAKTRIEGQYSQNVQAMQTEQTKSLSAKREHAEKVLAAAIKGWSPDHAKKLSEYALSKGAPAEMLQGISDAWMVQILDDAAYGHAMRKAAPITNKRVESAPKTLKPGAAGNPKSAAQAKANDAMKRLQKSGRVEDAALALLARSATRK